MGLRRSRRRMPATGLGQDHLRILAAVAAGDVVRDDCGSERVGMWALYRLHEEEVGMGVRLLARFELVSAPLVGPPTITADGLALLRPGSYHGVTGHLGNVVAWACRTQHLGVSGGSLH